MVYKFFDRARMTTTTTGTGTLTLGSAVGSTQKGYYQSFAAAGMADGNQIRYVIEDGSDWEEGIGTYIASGTQLSRDSVTASSQGGAKLNLSGNAEVFNALSARDFPGILLIKQEALVGNGTAVLTLANEPVGADGIILSIDGGPQQAMDSYSVLGKALTLSQSYDSTHEFLVTYLIGNPGSATADIYRNTWAAQAGTGTITLGVTPPSSNSCLVWYGTELQSNDGTVYSLSGAVLTYVLDPEGDDVTVLVVQGLVIGVPGDGTVTPAKLSNVGIVGQCRLTKSSSNLLLSPLNGNLLMVNGILCTVPDAGVTLVPTSLSVGTTYYIYAVATAGVITSLEASATGHSPSTTAGNKGTEIKTGDDTRSLVGMARVITGPAWVDTAAQRFVRSWFNRVAAIGRSSFTASRTTASATFVELNSEIRNEFLSWLDEAVTFNSAGYVRNGASGADAAGTAIGIDGTTPLEDAISYFNVSAASDWAIALGVHSSGLSEGYHYATLLGRMNSGTGSWYGAASGQARCVLTSRIG